MNQTHKTFNVKVLACLLAGALALVGGVSDANAAEKALYNFDGPNPNAGWGAVNDNVMGGVSKGGAKFPGDGRMLFAGTLSLENRGGFSSVRTDRKRVDLSTYDGLTARVRGDGRTYWMTVGTNVRIPAGSYRVTFRTEKGKWQTIRAPFKDFRATSFGRELPRAFSVNPAKVEQIGFLIADKKAGPFRLEVDWIKAETTGTAKTPAPGPAGPQGNKGKAQPKDIVDTAVAAGSFKTLAAALAAADLVETLKGKGPFTVFAPTDEAFAKLPKGTVQSLLRPENKKQLIAVLTHHVVAGRVTLGSQSLASLEGTPLSVAGKNCLTVNGAKVVTANIGASNGIIHVIDTVLVPQLPQPDPADAARSLITLAISRGVPLYNAGQREACAAIYEVAIQGLLQMDGSTLADAERDALRKALDKVADSDDARSNAWTLRRALDSAHRSLRTN